MKHPTELIVYNWNQRKAWDRALKTIALIAVAALLLWLCAGCTTPNYTIDLSSPPLQVPNQGTP